MLAFIFIGILGRGGPGVGSGKGRRDRRSGKNLVERSLSKLARLLCPQHDDCDFLYNLRVTFVHVPL